MKTEANHNHATMIVPTTTTTTSNRKRSRPLQKQGPILSSSKTSLRFLALAILFVLSSQASCAFGDSSSSVSQTLEIPNDSLELYEKIERFELDDDDDEEDEDDEWGDEDEEEEEEYNDEEDFEGEEDYEHKEGNINEEDYDYEDDFDEEDYEVDWTPEEYEQMDLLYDRYIEEIAHMYGANWEEEYELVVDKEEIYERYLEFQERKQREAEEQRQLSVASHKALLQHEEQSLSIRAVEKGHNNSYDNESSQNRTEDEQEQEVHQFSIESAAAPPGDDNGNTVTSDIPPRRHMVVLNTGISYYNYNDENKKNIVQSNGQECPAATPTTIITTRSGNSESVIGSI